MPTLYVENIPDELYESLRSRAREARSSIAAEVLSLLKDNVPTQSELAKRREFLRQAVKIRARAAGSGGSFESTEEMQRADRSR